MWTLFGFGQLGDFVGTSGLELFEQIRTQLLTGVRAHISQQKGRASSKHPRIRIER
jgi:hypothetical protein